MRHHLASGGEGIRSGIGRSLCQALGADSKDCPPAAVCLELVHRTSLVFDDIQDRTPTRNSQPALWAKYGIEQSLNAGLALSACARMALTKLTGTSLPQGCPLRILQLLERALVELCWGQCLDLEQQNGGASELAGLPADGAPQDRGPVGRFLRGGGHAAEMMDHSLPVFAERLGVLFQCQAVAFACQERGVSVAGDLSLIFVANFRRQCPRKCP